VALFTIFALTQKCTILFTNRYSSSLPCSVPKRLPAVWPRNGLEAESVHGHYPPLGWHELCTQDVYFML